MKIIQDIINTKAEVIKKFGVPPVAIRMNKATLDALIAEMPPMPEKSDFPLLAQQQPLPVIYGLPIPDFSKSSIRRN